MFNVFLEGRQKVRAALIGVVGKISAAAEFTLYQTAQQIRDEMREEGKPVTYPIQWDSEKQRRAFFATDGFGRGIPTQRSGISVGAWKAIKIEDGAQVFNPLTHIMFINGRRQSKIHKGRWKLFHVVVETVLSALPEKLRSRVKDTIQEQGFEPR